MHPTTPLGLAPRPAASAGAAGTEGRLRGVSGPGRGGGGGGGGGGCEQMSSCLNLKHTQNTWRAARVSAIEHIYFWRANAAKKYHSLATKRAPAQAPQASARIHSYVLTPRALIAHAAHRERQIARCGGRLAQLELGEKLCRRKHRLLHQAESLLGRLESRSLAHQCAPQLSSATSGARAPEPERAAGAGSRCRHREQPPPPPPDPWARAASGESSPRAAPPPSAR